MRKFRVVFCFLNKDGSVERDEHGEVYHFVIKKAYNGGDAIERFRAEEKFEVKPEIFEITEEL